MIMCIVRYSIYSKNECIILTEIKESKSCAKKVTFFSRIIKLLNNEPNVSKYINFVLFLCKTIDVK